MLCRGCANARRLTGVWHARRRSTRLPACACTSRHAALGAQHLCACALRVYALMQNKVSSVHPHVEVCCTLHARTRVDGVHVASSVRVGVEIVRVNGVVAFAVGSNSSIVALRNFSTGEML